MDVKITFLNGLEVYIRHHKKDVVKKQNRVHKLEKAIHRLKKNPKMW